MHACMHEVVLCHGDALCFIPSSDGTVVLDLEQMETVLLTVHTHESAG